MADITSVGLVVATSTVVNTVYAVDKGKEAGVTVLAGGMTLVILATLGGLTKRYDLAMAIAWVFLIGSIVFRGTPLIKLMGGVVQTRPSHVGVGSVSAPARPRTAASARARDTARSAVLAPSNQIKDNLK